MKKILGCLLIFLPQIVAAEASAEAYVYVSALQPPAWITHKNERIALGASAPIQSGDSLTTGPGARVHLALADGSLLKLGENTVVELQNLQLRNVKQTYVLTGSLKMSSGNMRYTAQKQRATSKSDLNLQIGRALLAQASSADLWAATGSAEDRLLLIEGSATVTPPQKPAVPMAQPNSVYTTYRNNAGKPDGISQMQEPRLLLQLTELDGRQPALQSNGPYRIVLATYPDEAKALERVRKYAALGYPVELQRPSPTSPGYRVILDGLPNHADAKAYAALLVQKLKLLKPQVEALVQ